MWHTSIKKYQTSAVEDRFSCIYSDLDFVGYGFGFGCGFGFGVGYGFGFVKRTMFQIWHPLVKQRLHI